MYRYIQAMTFDRKTAIRKVFGYDKVFSEHFTKLVVYSKHFPNNVDGWIVDIAKAIHNMSKVAIHSNLSYDDYFDNCFRDFGDCSIDEAGATLASEILRLSRKPVNPFPHIDFTEEQEEYMSNVTAMFKQELSKYLSDTDTVISIQHAKDFVKHILDVCK